MNWIYKNKTMAFSLKSVKVFNNDEMSSSSDDDDGTSSHMARTRRGISHTHGAFACALKSSRLQSNPVNSTDWMDGNPKYGNTMMLYCRTGYHLRVTPDGKVGGTHDEFDRFAVLEILTAGFPGHILIRGKESKMYVAMDKKGRLYGEVDSRQSQTIWLEELLGSYNTYMSRSFAHLGWFLAIKKSGKPKKGHKTGWGQKATQFLPRRIQ